MWGARRVGAMIVAAGLLVPLLGLIAPPAQAASKPKLRVYNASVKEGTGGQAIVAFSVQLSAKARKKVTFNWHTTKGTASRGGDYVGVSGGRGVIAKGKRFTTLMVKVIADNIDEYSETFGVKLTHVSSSVVVADRTARATIRDDDGSPHLRVTPKTVVEGANRAGTTKRILTAELSRPSGKPVSVRYKIVGGTAHLHTDVKPLKRKTRRLLFKPGQTTKSIPIRVHGDDKDQPNKTFRLVWSKAVHVWLPGAKTTITLLDDDGPIQPEIHGTTPVGPSPDASPLVYGLAPGGSTVQVYLNGSCSGAPVVTGSATKFDGTGLSVDVNQNTTNTITVKATNTVGGVDSDCSQPYTYVHDSIAPDAPNNLATDPTSPTQSHSVTVTGTAEAGSQVSVYLGANCTGTPIRGSADTFASTGIQVNDLIEGSNEIGVTATDAAQNTSACSSMSLVVDTIAPNAPGGLAVASGLPSGQGLRLSGTAEAGSTVRVFLDVCATAGLAGSGSAAQFGGAGVLFTDDLPEGDHTLFARAVDQAGNVGDCSAGLDVTVDRTPPAAPILDPVDTTGWVLTGTDSDPDAVTIHVHLSGDCTGPDIGPVTRGAFASTGVAFTPPSTSGTYDISAQAEDAVAHLSTCSAETFDVP
jgi:Calx-beta domain/Bacterial Ig-like domain